MIVREVLEHCLESREEFEEFFYEADQPSYFVTDAALQMWVVFCTEDGDWFATRPPWEDDDEAWRGLGPSLDLMTLPTPVRVVVR